MKKTVFTNGCFDLLHTGHIALLRAARAEGDRLIVAINSDESVKKIKGNDRPFQNQFDRKTVLESLKFVDEVYIFDELTPEKLIKEIKPDVLVKGGDWKENEIIGSEFVKACGGTVITIPLVDGFSTTNLATKINNFNGNHEQKTDYSEDFFRKSLTRHRQVFEQIENEEFLSNLKQICDLVWKVISNGNKILLCGNGGSASDAQHIATEFVGRYEKERKALPAIALNTDTSALTAISNDYDFSRVFSRQVEALAVQGDVLIAISTSGNSQNVINAVMTARKKGCLVIGLTGAKGKKLASLSDKCIMIPTENTANIQEFHILVGHIICAYVDKQLEV